MALLFASIVRATCSKPTFLSIMTKKAIEKIEIRSSGTHQLALRLISVNVLLGAINVFTRRCGSERPGPVGSGVTGAEETGYIGGGGGVGPVGELINHPTFQFVESYYVFYYLDIGPRHKSAFPCEMFPSALRQRPDFAIVAQNLYC